jgi:hypothetical protein
MIYDFLGGHKSGSFAAIVSGSRFPQTVQHDIDVLDQLVQLASPGAKIKIVQAVSDNTENLVSATKLASNLKLAGLVGLQDPKEVSLNTEERQEIKEMLKLTATEDFNVVEVTCNSPNFVAGSSRPLSFAQKIKKPLPKPAEKPVWSLDMDDDEVDLIDENDLLDEEDLIKPDEASLRVCGTTGKRKACKDCSCGLAEELDAGKDPVKKSVTSSCGSVRHFLLY